MAVAKLIQHDHGRTYCLLLDHADDSIEVVTEAGFVGMGKDGPQFGAAYYQEVQAPDIGAVLLRIDEATAAPVGLLLEHASKQLRRGWFRSGRSSLALFTALLGLARALEAVQRPEPLFEAESVSVAQVKVIGQLKQEDGGYVFSP